MADAPTNSVTLEGVLRIVGAVVHDPAEVEAMLRQSYAEGAYEGFLAGRRAVEE